MPHFGHVTIPRIVEVKAEVLIGVRTISSRLGNGRRVTRRRCVAFVHTPDIEPGETSNIPILLAFESTQADPQIFRLNDIAL